MARKVRCPCQGQTLDRLLQPALLSLLAREPLSGYSLLRRLGGLPLFAESLPDSTGLYRALRGLEDRGMVKGAWRLSRRGPAKRVFSLTPAGARCVANWVRTLDAYRRHLACLVALAKRRPRQAASGK
jgi:DNA-binding PadR family transcriptional regulator